MAVEGPKPTSDSAQHAEQAYIAEGIAERGVFEAA
jgi:hypothetical protein